MKRNWGVSRRVALIQWALPALIVAFVVLYQTFFVGFVHDWFGEDGHYVVEVVFYGAMGPLVTFFVLAWIRRWLVEKERVEQQMREQEKRLALIRVEEGKRVAQHLHREVLPNLAYVANKIDHTRSGLVQAADLTQAAQQLSKVTGTLRETIGELREKINTLRKGSPLEGFKAGSDLLTELRHRVDEFQRLLHLEIRIESRGDSGALPDALKSSLWRIIGEALNNVALHARAQRVVIELDCSDVTCMSLRIRDDGQGFDARARLAHPSGLGLAHMIDEATRWNGTLNVESTPGKGTAICAVLPHLQPEAQA